MLNIEVNKSVIKSLNPCKDRLKNYLTHYPDFNGSILEFLDLENITAKDRIWVTTRLLPREQVEYFAIDCAFSAAANDAYAADYDTAYYAASYADITAYIDTAAYYAAIVASASAADPAASYTIIYQNQIEVLKYLIKTA